MRLFLTILGVLMLLPGACSLIFFPAGVQGVSAFFKPPSNAAALDSFFGMVWLAGLVLGLVGVFLIVRFSHGR